ncbi:MAG: bifunctional helix-turn-helix domain-containing protein/methylated-DNA--[protein]-cysteine S-methyltransferase [Deltaproteobacteria bacterium]|nr:bifunctional helix-turn-helix domain-containing protein/methylated-DNA--[protein]-cysteine S-methyltransferase [Deltaproteobacteria bacterium]
MKTSRDFTQASKDYDRVGKALKYLGQTSVDQPRLDTIAQHIGLSPFHFQRIFKRWVGLSPKQFLDLLTLDHAKKRLEESQSLLTTSLDIGLSGPSRLHDLFIKVEAMTPGEYKQQGLGLNISYGFHPTPFGECLLATTSKGICWLSFVNPASRHKNLAAMKACWPKAIYNEEGRETAMLDAIFGGHRNHPLSLHVKGTPFQIKVWQALLAIPEGAVVSYEEIAKIIHCPKACRAVGTAVGSNPISYIIPCHRVIRKMGEFGNYGGGIPRKRAMLGWEFGQKR